MYTVMIADDEPSICELIRHLIRWEELGLAFMGSVHDGQELYQAIVQRRPDVVISDVVMPRMTGLDIIRRVREEGLDCSFIIISGHRHFDFVQESIKNGACDYLLKPINGDELNETLRRICAGMTDRLEEKTLTSNHRRELEQTLRRHLVTNAFYSSAELFRDANQLNREYSVSFMAGWYQAAIVVAEGSDEATLELIVRKSQTALEQALGEIGGYVVSCMVDRQALLLINYREEIECVGQQMEQAFATIRRQADMFSGVSVTLGCGKLENRFERFPDSIQTAWLSVRDRIRLGRNRIIEPQQRGTVEDRLENAVERGRFRQLAHIFDGLNQQRYEAWVEEVCGSDSESWSGNVWYELCERIGEVFGQIAAERGYEDKGDTLGAELLESLERAPGGRLARSLIQPVCRRMRTVTERQREQSSKPIRMAQEYIESHYMESISLEDVAGYVFLHPSYLSHVFKENLGIGFSEYLANCRLERAKYLLTNTNDTIYSIARQVGYTEPRAFSKFFLKIVGVKPSDYRRMYS